MHPCMRYSVYVYVSSCVHYMSLCTRIMIAGERARASEKGIERKTYRIDIDVGERGKRGRTYIPPSCPNEVATISRRQL